LRTQLKSAGLASKPIYIFYIKKPGHVPHISSLSVVVERPQYAIMKFDPVSTSS
jgi:hypothetical protein